MAEATDSERFVANIEEVENIEEGEIEIKDVIKVEPNQISYLEEGEDKAKLTDIIKVDPDHSLLLEEEILDASDQTNSALPLESWNAGSSHEKELPTIELVRLDQVRPEQVNSEKTTSSVATQYSPTRESTFPETVDNSNQTFASSLDRLPATRITEPASKEDDSRNRFIKLKNIRGDIEKLRNVRETKLKAKKVRMERERRKGLAELFDNLEASVFPQSSKSSDPSKSSARSRSSYFARILAAVDCIKELELKVI